MSGSVKDFKGKGFEKDDDKNKEKVEQNVNEAYQKYNKMSENELMREMEKEVKKLKNQGKLNPKILENFYNQMSPNMTSEQRKRLRIIINSIK